jgi:hypothetical protein
LTWAKKQDPVSKTTRAKKARGVAQVIKHLPSKHESLSFKLQYFLPPKKKYKQINNQKKVQTNKQQQQKPPKKHKLNEMISKVPLALT